MQWLRTLLFLKVTKVLCLEPTLSGSQLPIALGPGYLIPYSDLYWHLLIHVHINNTIKGRTVINFHQLRKEDSRRIHVNNLCQLTFLIPVLLQTAVHIELYFFYLCNSSSVFVYFPHGFEHILEHKSNLRKQGSI